MSSRTVKEYAAQGMPGSPGNWCLEDAQVWVDHNVRHPGEKRPRAAKPERGRTLEEDLFSGDGTSPWLEKIRKSKAGIAQIELRIKRGTVIPRTTVHDLLVRLSALIRSAGEQLQRQFGPEAALLLEEVLNDADREIDRFFTDGPGDRPAS